MQVSAAVGAFMLGIAISGATAHSATRILEPLRDLFAAIFFVVFGLNTDPSTIPPVLGWALVLAVVDRRHQDDHRDLGGQAGRDWPCPAGSARAPP